MPTELSVANLATTTGANILITLSDTFYDYLQILISNALPFGLGIATIGVIIGLGYWLFSLLRR